MLSIAISVPDGFKHLNWVDYVFLVVLVYSVVSGAWVGFFAECVSVAGVAVGTLAAGVTYHATGSALAHVGVPGDARDWAGFVTVFVVISLVFRVCSIKARTLSRVFVRGLPNQVAGGLLGLIVGAMICLFMVVTVAYFQVGKLGDPVLHSQIAINCKSLVKEYVPLLPQKMHAIPGFTVVS
jgi:uncharacterized membrane protein required for colicin V production